MFIAAFLESSVSCTNTKMKLMITCIAYNIISCIHEVSCFQHSVKRAQLLLVKNATLQFDMLNTAVTQCFYLFYVTGQNMDTTFDNWYGNGPNAGNSYNCLFLSRPAQQYRDGRCTIYSFFYLRSISNFCVVALIHDVAILLIAMIQLQHNGRVLHGKVSYQT